MPRKRARFPVWLSTKWQLTPAGVTFSAETSTGVFALAFKQPNSIVNKMNSAPTVVGINHFASRFGTLAGGSHYSWKRVGLTPGLRVALRVFSSSACDWMYVPGSHFTCPSAYMQLPPLLCPAARVGFGGLM